MMKKENKERERFLKKHFHIPEEKEFIYQHNTDPNQVIIPPMQPSALIIQKKRDSEMKEKEYKSLTDVVKGLADRVDKFDGKTDENLTARKFEKEMIKKSIEILQSTRVISGVEANVIESTVRLIESAENRMLAVVTETGSVNKEVKTEKTSVKIGTSVNFDRERLTKDIETAKQLINELREVNRLIASLQPITEMNLDKKYTLK